MNQTNSIKYVALIASLLSVAAPASAGWRDYLPNWSSQEADSNAADLDVAAVEAQQPQEQAEEQADAQQDAAEQPPAAPGRLAQLRGWFDDKVESAKNALSTASGAVAGGFGAGYPKAVNLLIGVKARTGAALSGACNVAGRYATNLAAVGTGLAVHWHYSDCYNRRLQDIADGTPESESSTALQRMIQDYKDFDYKGCAKECASGAKAYAASSRPVQEAVQSWNFAKTVPTLAKNNPRTTAVAAVVGTIVAAGSAYAAYRWNQSRRQATAEKAAQAKAARAVVVTAYRIREFAKAVQGNGTNFAIAGNAARESIGVAKEAISTTLGADRAERAETFFAERLQQAEQNAKQFQQKTKAVNQKGARTFAQQATTDDQVVLLKAVGGCLDADADAREAVIASLKLSDDNRTILNAIFAIV